MHDYHANYLYKDREELLNNSLIFACVCDPAVLIISSATRNFAKRIVWLEDLGKMRLVELIAREIGKAESSVRVETKSEN